MRKLVTNCINNLKLKNKLLVIYCVCVFLPIILCNLIFYVNISQNLIRHEKERINISMERIGETLIQSMQEVISVSNIIYNDPKLNSDLEKEYVDFIEFSDEYNNNLKYSVSKYYAIYEQIKEITIYTDNPTIVEASGYYSLGDEVKESDWYRNYVESKKNIIVYFDKNTGEINVIRKLNNFKDSSHYQKYLKIVLRKESINSIMYREKLKGNLKLFNNLGDTVSCSNFTIYDNKDQNRILKLSKNFDDSKYLKGWKIEGEFAYHIIISEISGSRDYIINIMVICLVIATIIIAIISKSLSSRIKIIIKHMNLVQKNEYVSIIMEESKDEIGELINEFNHMVMIIKKLIRDEYVLRINKQKLEIEMKQSQINALQSQMNPHFLFNSFESIKMRCLIKDEVETAEIIQALSKNFRRMISWNDDMVSVESEIEYIEDFIKIQKYRFKDKVHYEINVD